MTLTGGQIGTLVGIVLLVLAFSGILPGLVPFIAIFFGIIILIAGIILLLVEHNKQKE